ncbi:MAG: ABC transporter ATP-binding protein [Spirochaetota bacterium]
MLEVKNLTRKFDDKIAVNNISFQVKPGVVTGLLGPNGAGKTTTMRLITGFLQASSGDVIYNGKSTLEENIELKKKLGYLPESAPLYPEMKIDEYLQYMASIRGIATGEQKARIDEMVQLCELEAKMQSLIGHLSKGYKQRVALAGTLIHDPELIILDEPTSGLDPNQISHIRGLIKKLGKEKILILSTHILQEVEDICDEVIIIHNGQIVANSSVKGLHSGYKMLVSTNAETKAMESIFSQGIFQGVETHDTLGEGFYSYLVNMSEYKPEAVFESMRNSSFKVREIKVHKKSLETIFSELTK